MSSNELNIDLDKVCYYENTIMTDDIITTAKYFKEHRPEYGDWKGYSWDNPDPSVEHNAYHVRYLAEEMLRQGEKWLGGPLIVYPCLFHIKDGNHRYRALKYIQSVYDIDIPLHEVKLYTKDCWRKECQQ